MRAAVRWLALVLAVAMLTLGGPVQAAESIYTHRDWTAGSFEVGMAGAGKHVFPELVPAPDHERIPFPVNPCHRELSLGLDYEPQNASARVTHEGNAAEATLPYRFRVSVFDPDGSLVRERVVAQPDLSIGMGTTDQPGEHTLVLELLEGALVDWEVRMRGWATEDPSCDVWLNEVETNPAEGSDWVELYNEGTETVDLTGWSVHADRTNVTASLDADELAPGEHRQVLLDGDALAEREENLTLRGPQGSPIDASPPLSDDASDDRTWQKEGDGLGEWIFAPGTPGEPNAG